VRSEVIPLYRLLDEMLFEGLATFSGLSGGTDGDSSIYVRAE